MGTGLGTLTVNALLEATSAKTPTPGGGAIAGVTGGLAAALAGMVVSYSIGKKDLAAAQERLMAAQAKLAEMRAEFIALGDRDAEAYGMLNALQKLPPEDAKRQSEMPAAIDAAVGVPVRCLRLSVELARLCAELAPITNKWLASDLKIASALAEAAARASVCNVLVNAPLIEDAQKRATITQQCGAMVKECKELAVRVGG